MLVKWYPGRKVTIIAADSFVCLQVSEAEALAKLKARGVRGERARALLTREVPAAEWRAGFIHAAAATAVAVEESLSRVAESEDVDNVRSDLGAAVAGLKADIDADRFRLERRQLEIHLGYEAERHTQIALSTGLAPGRDLEAAIWAQLWKTPAGLRLQELRDSA